MRKNGREAKKAGFFIDARCLDRRDLMPAKALADNVQPARQRGIAEGAVRLAGEGGPDGGNERLLWIGQLHLRLGKGSRNGSDRITGAVHGCHPPRSGHQSSRRLENSAHAFDALISTIRTASMRARGDSTPKRRGGSPLST